jgi:hypothetical protein
LLPRSSARIGARIESVRSLLFIMFAGLKTLGR